MRAMKLQRILMAGAGLAVLFIAWNNFGTPGLAVASGAIVMWLLLHFSRVMHVVRQASERPVGYVASAIMLNAKLKPKVNLLYVMSLTRAMGEQLSPKDEQPEVFRWTDPGGSHVTCEPPVSLQRKTSGWTSGWDCSSPRARVRAITFKRGMPACSLALSMTALAT